MDNIVCAVYDSKVEEFLTPFVMRTKGEAIRGWIDVVNDEKTNFYKHPEDFTLFQIGTYDPEKGSFTNNEAKTPLGTALEYQKGSIQ